MKKTANQLVFALLMAFGLLFTACSGGTDAVESGTYEGTISEVEPEETEIYVETADNKKLELYFTEETQLLRNGNAAKFSELQEDQKVRVTVEKVGQRLNPLKVEILE